MSLFRQLFGAGRLSADATANEAIADKSHEFALAVPSWTPRDVASRRLVTFGLKVAQELTSLGVEPTVTGGNYWVISYDVHEAIWYTAAPGSWAERHGRIRDGWSQGECLILFQSGELACAEWFGEVDLSRGNVKVENPAPLTDPDARWSSGNLARWREGTGGFHPDAREYFRGFWPIQNKPLPDWASTSAQVKHFLVTHNPRTPRYY